MATESDEDKGATTDDAPPPGPAEEVPAAEGATDAAPATDAGEVFQREWDASAEVAPPDPEAPDAPSPVDAPEGAAPPPDDLDTPDPEALSDSPDDLARDEAPALSVGSSAPVVTGVRPDRCDTRGGTTLTVLGAGFSPGCSVFLGDEELIAEVIDTFTLRFVAPAGVGRRPVHVQTAGGNRSPASVEVTFIDGPEITSATPAEGPVEGGVIVTLEGKHFAEGCAVSLFGEHAPEVIFESSERLRFMLPPASFGPLDGAVVVTNRDGLSGRSETAFRYRPLNPRIYRVDPAAGWVSGGKIVSAHGTDFHARTRVFFGPTEAKVRFTDPTRLELEVPAASAVGPVDVRLQNPDGKETTLERGFTYEPVPAPPKLIDVFPKTGLTLGGLTIRINGDNFTDDVRVRIGDVTAVRKVVSSKLIDVEVPPRATPGLVAIDLTLEGVTVRFEDVFTYTSPAAPKITHLEPRTGPTTGGTKVVIEGEGFPKNASVRFGEEMAKVVTVKDATRIETVTPKSLRAAIVDVVVSSNETGPGVAKGGFKYEVTPPPTITSVAPAKGTTDGGSEIGIEGKNFAEGVVVLFGGVAAKSVRRTSGSLLEAKTPPGDDGKLVDVTVKNPDGQQAIQKRAFQYDARYRS